jgi:hypothetical protein
MLTRVDQCHNRGISMKLHVTPMLGAVYGEQALSFLTYSP